MCFSHNESAFPFRGEGWEDIDRQEIVIRTRIPFPLVGIFVLAGALRANPPTPAPYMPILNQVSDFIVTHRYAEAEAKLDSLQRIYPESTDVRLQEVVLLFTWIDDYGIADSLGPQFMAGIDTVILFANRDIAKNPRNAWAHFFKGSARAYRSLFRSYVEGIGIGNILSLISDASSGMDELERARQIDTSFADPLIGIGKYLHWKSKKFPRPFSSPKEGQEGIRLLEKAVRMGAQADGGAVQTLGWVYMAERRYDDAIALVSPLARRYPRSRFFTEIIARAYLEKGEYAEADSFFQQIMDALTPQERASPFIVMKYKRWIARIRLLQGRPEEACRIARRLKDLNYTGVHHDWLDRKMGEVDKVIREACR